MTFNVISYTSFLFVMVVFFSSQTFAPWTATRPPRAARDGIARNCIRWIKFNGFTLNSSVENLNRARARDYKLDKKATAWAAIYAFLIAGAIEVSTLYPHHLCASFGDEGRQLRQFVALENERKTCDKWITLYRFSENHLNNISLVVTQRQERMSAVSIWAHIYYLYVVRFGDTNLLTPTDFCTKIGKSVVDVEENRMIFMSEDDTRLTCYKWIELFEYTDNPHTNLNKAIQMDNDSQNHYLYMHYFPFTYAEKLLEEGVSDDNVDVMTPEVFCSEYNGDGPQPTEYGLGYLGPEDNHTVFITITVE